MLQNGESGCNIGGYLTVFVRRTTLEGTHGLKQVNA